MMKSMYQLIFALLFCEIMRSNAMVSDKDVAALRGNKVTIPCIIVSSKTDEILDLATEYHWTDSLGVDLLDNRFFKNEAGDLEISDLHAADSGIYKCKVLAPINIASERVMTQTFPHKLLVYELTGHTFVTHVPIDMLIGSSIELFKDVLKGLINNFVCQQGDLCLPGSIHVQTCKRFQSHAKRCMFAISYRATDEINYRSCDEDCLRSTMIERLKKAEKNLLVQLIQITSNPQSKFKADVKEINVDHLVTCEAGFHLIHTSKKYCFPCQPGTYSGPNSSKCNLCEIGYYQENYGKHACSKCPKGQTTEAFGSKSEDDCVDQSRNLVESVKKGILEVFGT